jgi:hypothetical protein
MLVLAAPVVPAKVAVAVVPEAIAFSKFSLLILYFHLPFFS